MKWAPELITGVMGGAVISAAAERRLSDEYEAAQERGEVAADGRPKTVPDENGLKPATAADIGLSRKDIHEARQIRDAEKAEPVTPPSVHVLERHASPALSVNPSPAAVRGPGARGRAVARRRRS